MNEQITAKIVRLISKEGTQVGVVPIEEALRAAKQDGLDLVEVAPNAAQPVCRIMDYGKLRYERSKKGKTKSRSQHLKEIKLRPLTQEHDIGVKIKNIRRFLGQGDRVRVSMVFRGRERTQTDLALTILQQIAEEVEDIGLLEVSPTPEARDISMLIIPR